MCPQKRGKIIGNKVYKKENTEMQKVPDFEIPNVLYSGQEEILRPHQKGEDIWWIIKPSDVANPGTVTIKFENLRGKEFSYSFEIKKRCTDEKGWTYYEIKMKK